MTEDMKKAEQIASERINSEMLESEKKYLAEKKRLSEEEAASEERLRRREYAERLAKAKNNLAVEKATRNEMLRLQKNANDAYLAELKAEAEREREVYNQLKSDIKNTYSEILSFAENSIGETEKKRAQMEEKLSQYGRLTKKVTFRGTGEHGEDEVFTELFDLNKTTDTLRKYASSLSEIKSRMSAGGVSADTANSLISMISSMSVEKGSVFAGLLSKTTDREFKEYINAWQEKENVAKGLSARLYEDEMRASVSETISFMTEELNKMGLSVPDGFFLSGGVSAEKFGEGFVAQLSEEMDIIQKAINSFNLSLDVNMGASKGGNTSVYSPTYQINTSSASDALSQIKATETRKVLSGIV